MRSVNSADGLPRRLQETVNESGSYTSCKLCCETDDGRNGKDKIIQEDEVEVAEPLEPTIVTQQVKVGNTCKQHFYHKHGVPSLFGSVQNLLSKVLLLV